MLSRMDMRGMAITEEPKCRTMSENSNVVFPIVVWNGGSFMSGNPDATCPVIFVIRNKLLTNKWNNSRLVLWLCQNNNMDVPVNENGFMSYKLKQYANAVPIITAKAFRPSDKYFLNSLYQRDESGFSLATNFLLYLRF